MRHLLLLYLFFFLNDPPPPEFSPLPLPAALPIGDDREGEPQPPPPRSRHEDQCASPALEHDELRENPRVRTAVAHPEGGVRLCIMRRPPQGTKSRQDRKSVV